MSQSSPIIISKNKDTFNFKELQKDRQMIKDEGIYEETGFVRQQKVKPEGFHQESLDMTFLVVFKKDEESNERSNKGSNKGSNEEKYYRLSSDNSIDRSYVPLRDFGYDLYKKLSVNQNGDFVLSVENYIYNPNATNDDERFTEYVDSDDEESVKGGKKRSKRRSKKKYKKTCKKTCKKRCKKRCKKTCKKRYKKTSRM